jgi:hypothetical protein
MNQSRIILIVDDTDPSLRLRVRVLEQVGDCAGTVATGPGGV